jgi:2-oxoglutarate ferredoxin oxidoreductase subunit alpha
MNSELQSAHNHKLQEKYALVEKEALDYEEVETRDAECLFVAFGISARICFTAVRQLRAAGLRIGLLRPKTLFPFPARRLFELGSQVKKIIVVELNNGQMANDVELAVKSRLPVLRYNWMGGIVPSCNELMERVRHDVR